MYRTILFDLDGTLTDSREGILNCLRYALETLGYPVPAEETLLKFIGPPLQESFIEWCGLTMEQAFEAIAVFRRRYDPVGQFENRPAPGLLEVCTRLKEAGYTLALASSKPEKQCVEICRRFGFAPLLTAIVGSPPQGDSSKAAMIQEAFRRLGLEEGDRSSVLMVGDRKYDVLGARACGIDCVGVEFFGYAPPGELKEAGAVAVVETAQELEAFIRSHGL